MSWLDRLFGGLKGSVSQTSASLDFTADEALVRKDLGRLDSLQAGLGEGLVQYVMRGDNDSVLLTLAPLKAKARETIEGRSFGGNTWISGRGEFLLQPKVWRPDALRRYGDVLAVIFDQPWIALSGTTRSPGWLRALVRAYAQSHQAVVKPVGGKAAKPPSGTSRQPWTVEQLRSLLGEDLTPILDLAFERDDGWAERYKSPESPEAMDGFEDHIRADPTRRTAELRTLSAKARGYGLRLFARLGLVEGPYFDVAFDSLGDSAKGPREAAAVLLRGADPVRLAQAARSAWPAMKATQKTELARLAAAVCAGADAGLLEALLEGEKNEGVRAELVRLSAQGAVGGVQADGRVDDAGGFTAVDGAWLAAPDLAPLPQDPPVSAALRAAIERYFEAWRQEAEAHNREQDANPGARRHRMAAPSRDAADSVIAAMEGRARSASYNRQYTNQLFWPWGLGKARKAIQTEILAHADLTLWHLARLVDVREDWRGDDNRAASLFFDTPMSAAMRARLGPDQDVRLYAAVITALGSAPAAIARYLVGQHYVRPDYDQWPPGAIWPYCAAHLAVLDEALGLAAVSVKTQPVELRGLEVLEQFPRPPARYFPALLDRAVGDRKLVRAPARALLSTAPGLDALLVPLLQHPKSETRAGVAEWLADRGDASALPSLLAAASGERQPGPKAAMLSAIARLGGDISGFVSPGTLLAEAEAGLKKTADKALAWFPLDGLPALRRKDGQALDPRIARWWLALAMKLKTPGGSAWFDLLLDELQPADAARLGEAVMAAWIAYDTAAPSDAEANAYAQANVDARLAYYARWKTDVTREQLFAQLRQEKLRAYYGSGNDQKGVLALAARASGLEVVNMVRAYFRDHYTRTAQCKALLEALAANPSPVATQFVLNISKRWRTRGVQDLAVELVTTIAERRGWTAEELADRTIPTGGFDDDGVLELPIGERSYVARLDAAGAIGLFNPDGKAVQSLPASAAGDAAAALKEAKSLLSTARKEVKQVSEFQTRRLYEALCVGRDWSAPEWSEHLLHHPLMGRLVQRLVWLATGEDGQVAAVFRPMDDLTLTDVEDSSVALDPAWRVRLAHGALLPADAQAAWNAHLKDYEIRPLFPQFGRETLTVDGAAAKGSDIDERKGWMVETFKLRSAATKLGYVRGQAEDGGWFMTYEKPFAALGLTTIIEFTGNGLPEENRAAALVALRFVRPRKGWMNWSHGVPLSTVPPVLLSEAWNDLREMAATGTGFDAEWEKKAGW